MSTALPSRRPSSSAGSPGDAPSTPAPDVRARPVVTPLAAVLLVAVAACGGTAPATGGEAVAAPAPATAGASGTTLPTNAACADPAVEAAAIARINQVRAAGATCGGQRFAPAAPLRLDPRLTRAAAAHSADMAANDYFSHVGRDGRQVGERLSAVGYDWRQRGREPRRRPRRRAARGGQLGGEPRPLRQPDEPDAHRRGPGLRRGAAAGDVPDLLDAGVGASAMTPPPRHTSPA